MDNRQPGWLLKSFGLNVYCISGAAQLPQLLLGGAGNDAVTTLTKEVR
jgi:hypothetical protein